ncbi:MAG: hypothetical protein LAP21_28835 [Acidobacteriia bacterium]|nr:hypothetical protein [Terriglobia bacterium]
MHSSISSSDVTEARALSFQERPRTAGIQPPRGLERPVPVLPWLRILLVVASTALVLVSAWEIEMRRLGLRAGDLDDERGYWTVERRKVDAGPRDSVVILGDSRILLDTDLDTWQKLTGRRPIQLALLGSNAQPILHDFAADEHFAGLLVIGTAEFSYFGNDGNSVPAVLNYIRTESPSQRSGIRIQKTLSRYFAFLDSNYTLFKLLERHKWPERKGVKGPYIDVWKISESYDDRQTYLWERIERDDYLRDQSRTIWTDFFAGPPVKAATVDRVSASTRSDIDRIRARGGEVVWVRPPSGGPLLDIERTRYPRAEVWDKLMHDTASFGVHFEDYPAMQQLRCPDWSHLSRRSATAFTDAYVRVLLERVEWLRVRNTADTADGRLKVKGLP